MNNLNNTDNRTYSTHTSNNRHGRKRVHHSPALILAITILLFFSFMLTITFVNVNAGKSGTTDSMQKEYVSVQIEHGESLWSIAKDYMGVGYSDINAYIKDIKKINSLKSDTIHEGCYIIVPRYVFIVEE